MKNLQETIEPTIIHIRTGTNNELRKEMVTKLVNDHGYLNLEVNSLMRDETERRTKIGLDFLKMVQAGKIIPAEMTVRMLRKIIFSGQNHKKFILSSFPEMIEHVQEFEKNCAKIQAIFFTTDKEEDVVELKNNNLTLFNIDSLFQKEARLKIINEWSFERFEELLGNKIDFAVVNGPYLSGKSTIA